MTLALALAVGVGGALGAVVRYLTTVALAGREQPPGPVVIVNIAGSLISGLAIGAIDDPAVLIVVVTGFCGGLTTFSTLTVETVQLVMDGRAKRAVGGMLVNLIAGTLAVALGAILGAMLGAIFGG